MTKRTLKIGVLVLAVLSLSLTFYLAALPQLKCRGHDTCAEVCERCRKLYDCVNARIRRTVCGENDGMCYSEVSAYCIDYEAWDGCPCLPPSAFGYFGGVAYCEIPDSTCRNSYIPQ